ncbi:hypothetical protein [Actinocorallia lasiicapitis]
MASPAKAGPDAWLDVPMDPVDEHALLWDVAVTGPRSAVAVGSIEGDDIGPVILRWDGSSWTSVPEAELPENARNMALVDVSASSPKNVWGFWGDKAMHWNGTAWKLLKVPGISAAYDSISYGGRNVLVAGDVQGGAVTKYVMKRYDGAWHTVKSPGMVLRMAKGSGKTIWAVGQLKPRTGSKLKPGIARWTGSSWRRETLPKLKGVTGAYELNSVAVVGPKNVWVTGTAYKGDKPTAILLRWNGRTWRQEQIGRHVAVHEVAPDGRGGVWLRLGTPAGNYLADYNGGKLILPYLQGIAVHTMANIPGTRRMLAVGVKYGVGAAGIRYAP